MCGIAGIFSRGRIDEADKRLVRKMNNCLIHRGPDGSGEYFDEKVGLAHRRLSILDMSTLGVQPMFYMDRYVIVFNGEIYNYKELKKDLEHKGYQFATKTDTEVLVAAYDCWKEKCLSRLNGMWAFVIYDRKENILFISRDRFGVKPLFYFEGKGYLLFASEIKAILCDSRIKRVANDELVYDFLKDSLLDHTDESFFVGINKVPQASYARIDLVSSGKMEFVKYYSVDFTKIDDNLEADSAAKTFRNLFMTSVALRLRSDVPVGTCLSGGLDSSSIVTAVNKFYKRREKDQHTFSFCPTNRKISEKKYIDKVLRGKRIEEHFVGDQDFNVIEDFETFVYAQDEPFRTMSMFAGYLVYKEAKKAGIKVLLDGQGADEILCGYRKSRIYYIQELMEKRKYLQAAKETILSFSQIFTTSSIKSDFEKIWKIIFKDDTVSHLKSNYLNDTFISKHKSKQMYSKNNFQDVNVGKISLPVLLRYVDRNAMSVSVESRLPFLDYRIVNFAARIPLSLKIQNGYSKYIMRKALDMPEEIRKRRDKFGFVVPEKEWLNYYSDYFIGYFSEGRFRAGKYINNGEVVRNWSKLINGSDENLLFRMLSVAAWMEKFDVETA